MTYGVDECRVCGKPMKPSGPEALQRYNASLRQSPTMTEREWRALGLKAMPTRRQLVIKHDGCCFDCSLPMGLSGIPHKRLILPAIGILVAIMVTYFLIGTKFN